MLTRLNHRITIQTLTTVSVGGGCFEETWTNSYNRWANVQIQSAKESFSYNKDQQNNVYKIVMRTENFTNKNRIKYGDLILRIESVSDPTQSGRMMELIAFGELL